MHRSTAIFLLSIGLAGAFPLEARENATFDKYSTSNCFPYGSATLNKDLSQPSVSRDAWWCPQSLQYGFQGFSYPMEDADCNAKSNSYEHINQDFAAMKKDFGATMVRVYYPVCTKPSVFENLLRAGVNNNMAIIPQVWFDFSGNTETGKLSQQALYDVMSSSNYGPIAPYVFHSADFGSEPIGDKVDGEPDHFINDLKSFRATMNGYGVPVGISEDWNRPGTMSSLDGQGLGDIGIQVKQNSDYAHAHIMPYYQGNLPEAEAWPFIISQLQFLKSTVQLTGILITETQWAWGPNDHHPSKEDFGDSQYTAYWKKYDSECETFKSLNVGWFLHAWQGESSFDLKKDTGSYVIPNWRPRKC